MTEGILDLLLAYIDAKVAYEIASKEPGADGYFGSDMGDERQIMEAAKKALYKKTLALD